MEIVPFFAWLPVGRRYQGQPGRSSPTPSLVVLFPFLCAAAFVAWCWRTVSLRCCSEKKKREREEVAQGKAQPCRMKPKPQQRLAEQYWCWRQLHGIKPEKQSGPRWRHGTTRMIQLPKGLVCSSSSLFFWMGEGGERNVKPQKFSWSYCFCFPEYHVAWVQGICLETMTGAVFGKRFCLFSGEYPFIGTNFSLLYTLFN